MTGEVGETTCLETLIVCSAGAVPRMRECSARSAAASAASQYASWLPPSPALSAGASPRYSPTTASS